MLQRGQGFCFCIISVDNNKEISWLHIGTIHIDLCFNLDFYLSGCTFDVQNIDVVQNNLGIDISLWATTEEPKNGVHYPDTEMPTKNLLWKGFEMKFNSKVEILNQKDPTRKVYLSQLAKFFNCNLEKKLHNFSKEWRKKDGFSKLSFSTEKLSKWINESEISRKSFRWS